MPSDLTLFVRQMLRSPQQVGAVVPSSARLAAAMAAHLGPDTGPVIEFGAGTGRITRAILDRCVAPRDLTLFEMNPDFVAGLRQRFPGVTVHDAMAQDVVRLCAPGAGAVVSGLPLLAMRVEIRREILEGAFAVLRAGGTYTQFTYGPHSPVDDALQSALGLRAEKGRSVWLNLPPARVWRYVRAD